jgi:hypothetical protein
MRLRARQEGTVTGAELWRRCFPEAVGISLIEFHAPLTQPRFVLRLGLSPSGRLRFEPRVFAALATPALRIK